ncbi:MAG TPA: hypothetical protein VLS46_06785 [Gaiellaceae bacterium]|nr:hypothetical protein [Gaiellaceae bacterium]
MPSWSSQVLMARVNACSMYWISNVFIRFHVRGRELTITTSAPTTTNARRPRSRAIR